jgi:GMP synthase-like glutamine amidotransferase
MHRDIVFEYPEGVEELGWSPKCSVQGMYLKGKFITVQGHPEFTGPMETEIINFRHSQGIFDDALFEDGMKRVNNLQDGVTVSSAFLRFLMED